MKKSVLTLPLTLTALTTALLLAAVFLRTFWPQLIFPRPDIPTVSALCLTALVVQAYLSPQADHSYVLLAVLGAVNFGLLPTVALLVPWQQGLLLGAAGLVLLPGLTAVFTSLRGRLDSGPKAPLAPLACALCLYLAMQAFRGIFL